MALSTSRDGIGLERRHVAYVGGVLIAVWLLLVFGRALGNAAAVDDLADLRRAENAVLQAQLDAGAQELRLIESEPFIRIQARAYGVGEPGERVFTLRTDGRPAPAVPLLGEAAAPAAPTPLEDWLDLLFGP